MTLRYETLFFSVYHTVFIDRYLGYIWTDLIEKKRRNSDYGTSRSANKEDGQR